MSLVRQKLKTMFQVPSFSLLWVLALPTFDPVDEIVHCLLDVSRGLVDEHRSENERSRSDCDLLKGRHYDDVVPDDVSDNLSDSETSNDLSAQLGVRQISVHNTP